MLRWELRALQGILLRDRVLPAVEPVQVRRFDLGEVQGVPLCFTDASPLPDGVGCSVALPKQYGMEGIEAHAMGAHLGAWLVTDADDPDVPASLLRWNGQSRKQKPRSASQLLGDGEGRIFAGRETLL